LIGGYVNQFAAEVRHILSVQRQSIAEFIARVQTSGLDEDGKVDYAIAVMRSAETALADISQHAHVTVEGDIRGAFIIDNYGDVGSMQPYADIAQRMAAADISSLHVSTAQ